jgi:hypothetical protein
MIKLTRHSVYADRFRSYKVMLDGMEIGEIKNGEEKEFDVAPGRHQLYLAIDWCRSNTIEFEAGEDVTEFECASNLQGKKLFLALYYILFKNDGYIALTRVS